MEQDSSIREALVSQIENEYGKLVYTYTCHIKQPEQETATNENQSMSIPIHEKYALTVREAAAYFNMGIKKMRRLAEDNLGRFSIESGNRYLILRGKFEQFLDQNSSV